jgi:hypothetical protein
MCCLAVYVNKNVHHRPGRALKRSFTVQAFTAARLLQEGLFGVRTITQASIACGVSPRYVAAALTILQTRDEVLADAVLTGREPLLSTAANMRNCATLVTALENATADEIITFSRVVNPTALFDSVIVPALEAAE